MTRDSVFTDRARPLGAYAHVRRAGPFLYLCGTSSRRPDGTHEGVTVGPGGVVSRDIRLQTRAVLRNMEALLERAGASLADLIDATTFLVSMDDFAGYNEAWAEFFEPGAGPTRTTVAVAELPHPNLLIEIKGIAYLGEPPSSRST